MTPPPCLWMLAFLTFINCIIFVAADDDEIYASLLIAAGCFWCGEQAFEQYVPGVLEAVSGYAGGSNESPTYSNHGTYGHYEVVEITYDTTKATYKAMVEYAWRNIDPTDGNGQFCDRGSSYRPAIFYADERERTIAEEVRDDILQEYSWTEEDVVGVALLERPIFWKAEEYHQDYYIKKPNNYGFYKNACGRKKRLIEVWGQDSYDCRHSLESACFLTVFNEEGVEVTAEVNAKGTPPEKVGLLPDFAINVLIVVAVVVGLAVGFFLFRKRSRHQQNKEKKEKKLEAFNDDGTLRHSSDTNKNSTKDSGNEP